MRGMRNFEFHEKLSMQVQRRDYRHRIIRNAGDSKPPVSAEAPPVFRTSANHNAHEVSASLTGLSTKKRGKAISIIVPSRCVRMPKGKYMAGLRKSV